MSTSTPHVVTARSLRDVIALVPFECGFHPRHSLVVLSLRGPRQRIGQVTRIDLPPAQDAPDVAARIASFVARDQGRASVVVVYDHQPWSATAPPHLALVTGLLEELARAGAPAQDAAYVAAQRYWSYLCCHSDCCPEDGRSVADAMASPMAAALVVAGLAPLPSREDLAAQLQPTDMALVAEVVARAWDRLEAADSSRADDREGALTLVEELLPGFLAGNGSVEVEQAARLVAALQDVNVRDELLLQHCRVGLPLGRQPDASAAGSACLLGLGPARPPDQPAEQGLQRLLVALCARVDGPLAAAPLTVLAWHSWARGEGALARIAVDRALTEQPTYRLAGLLSAALDHGVAPDWVEQARRGDRGAR